jgi:acyl-CoA thioesterase II
MIDPVPPAAATPDHQGSVARLLAQLDVEVLERDLFRGQSTNAGWMRVYGGQVVAQALMAASKTVEDRLCHSLHSYFIRPGDPSHPIIYRVERDRDGQSFTTRRVIAIQHGRPIFNMAASFQVAEAGLVHGIEMPAGVPAPETLRTEAEWAEIHADRTPEPQRSLWKTRERPIDFRVVEHVDPITPAATPPFTRHWSRAAARFAATEPMARALFAYASDMTMLDTCLLPHAIAWSDPRLQVASLDHAIWFNTTPDLNDWLLFDQDSPVAGGGRGLNRATVYSRAGAVVASVVQEGLIRYRDA